MVQTPEVTASNPYLDFSKMNGLDYGDVLNFVGVMDDELQTYWHLKATANLKKDEKLALAKFRDNLREHYGIK